jgi:hypothetical protein
MAERLAPEELVPDEETLAHEAQAVEDVAGGLGDALAPVVARLLTEYAAGRAGSSLAALVQELLAGVRWPRMTPALQDLAVESVDLGVDRALRTLPVKDRRKGRGPGPVLEVPDLDRVTRVRLRQAADLARTLPLDTKRDLMSVVGKVSAAKSYAEGQVRWTANEGINAGTSAVAKRLGRRLLWVAERDACLGCLAHAGWSVKPGETFPPGLTFGDKPVREDGVPHPPLHPGCRCQVRVWDGPAGPPPGDRSSTSQAARLAAEARRSVVYGWTAYESHAATVRAMDRLLRAGAGLPASVERRARELARKGKTLPTPRRRP